jgi:hypothetical protein
MDYNTIKMNTFAWRRLLLALCALGLIEVVAMIAMQLHAGNPGFSAAPTGVPFVRRVVVDDAGAATAAGLRTGDLLDVRRLRPAARLRLGDQARAGEPIVIPVDRAGRALSFAVVPQIAPISWDNWLYYATQLWTILFCALLAWRRSESREVRLLTLFLLVVVVLGQSNWLTPRPQFDATALAIERAFLWGGFLLIVVYAETFGRPVSTFRRALSWFAALGIAFTVALAEWRIVGWWAGFVDPFAAMPGRRVLLLVGCLLTLFAAVGAARGAERTRVLWATAALAPVMMWAALADAIPALASTYGVGTNILFILIPVVLTYSLLNRRLVDIGFIVNRAAIFTTISIVLVGTFVLVESLLTDWLRGASHTTNVLFSAGLALVLGFSVRWVHGRIDRFVDEVFFKKRHDDEQAIRAFANDAPYITEASILIERVRTVLEAHTDAKSVSIVLDDGGRYGGVGENDPAIVRLRSTHKPVDLHELSSQLAGEIAFPMVARGHLVGAVVLDARGSGEAYAPDEAAAIAHLAHSAGYGLDVLASSSHQNGELLSAINALRSELANRNSQHFD